MLLNFTRARFISMTARCICAWVTSVGRTWMRSKAVRMISPPLGLKLKVPLVWTTVGNMAHHTFTRIWPVVAASWPGALTDQLAVPSADTDEPQVAVKTKPVSVAEDGVVGRPVVGSKNWVTNSAELPSVMLVGPAIAKL